MTAATESTAHPTSPARTLTWPAFGLANVAVVVVLGVLSWWLLVDPAWSPVHSYPQPSTAMLFWTIISTVWLAGTTFLLYSFVVAGTALHEPVVAGGLHGEAPGFMNWLVLRTLWYVLFLGSFGLPGPRADTTEGSTT